MQILGLCIFCNKEVSEENYYVSNNLLSHYKCHLSLIHKILDNIVSGFYYIDDLKYSFEGRYFKHYMDYLSYEICYEQNSDGVKNEEFELFLIYRNFINDRLSRCNY